jgi:hypothetical protein
MKIQEMQLTESQLITIIDIARVALEYDYIQNKIMHELGLTEDECNQIYALIEPA